MTPSLIARTIVCSLVCLALVSPGYGQSPPEREASPAPTPAPDTEAATQTQPAGSNEMEKMKNDFLASMEKMKNYVLFFFDIHVSQEESHSDCDLQWRLGAVWRCSPLSWVIPRIRPRNNE